jgi:hypothetical protein
MLTVLTDIEPLEVFLEVPKSHTFMISFYVSGFTTTNKLDGFKS